MIVVLVSWMAAACPQVKRFLPEAAQTKIIEAVSYLGWMNDPSSHNQAPPPLSYVIPQIAASPRDADHHETAALALLMPCFVTGYALWWDTVLAPRGSKHASRAG